MFQFTVYPLQLYKYCCCAKFWSYRACSLSFCTTRPFYYTGSLLLNYSINKRQIFTLADFISMKRLTFLAGNWAALQTLVKRFDCNTWLIRPDVSEPLVDVFAEVHCNITCLPWCTVEPFSSWTDSTRSYTPPIFADISTTSHPR